MRGSTSCWTGGTLGARFACSVSGASCSVTRSPALDTLLSAGSYAPRFRQVVQAGSAQLASTKATVEVDCTTDWLEMLGVDAPAIAAQVVEVEAVRDAVTVLEEERAMSDASPVQLDARLAVAVRP